MAALDEAGSATEARYGLPRLGESAPAFEAVTTEQAAERVTDGYECVDWYLCTKKV